MTEKKEQESSQEAQKKVLDKRLDSIGWGLFLIMIGGLWLIPDEKIPEGTWLIGVGVIILSLMGVRYLHKIKVSGFWLVLGIIALVAGIGDFTDIDIPVFPILIILVGVSIVVKPLTKKK